ncbi:hypothetical protein J2Z21_001243 [Streptomyces griseochromogenes]|uniref:Uncharacterized protein n=1 Tax=Streptomyces griseochromogenes TaxID=68214 RepID=A0A1B1AU12_9ACTN|nr:hypothetical protein [Streptomyces griseochromogenes]ANP50064.1 hypothetical protein AVL59_10975 [Streptomyces griseochromogenes]MBP2048319.1 hypothetical protein [Streptomyces griseochromogenes]
MSAGKQSFDKRLPDSERTFREVFAELRPGNGAALVGVGQAASIGALPLASPVARAARWPVRPA